MHRPGRGKYKSSFGGRAQEKAFTTTSNCFGLPPFEQTHWLESILTGASTLRYLITYVPNK